MTFYIELLGEGNRVPKFLGIVIKFFFFCENYLSLIKYCFLRYVISFFQKVD